MKKLLALVMLLCMITSFGLADEIPELTWESAEAAIAEAGFSGTFQALEDIAIQIWVPDQLLSAELEDEEREAGFIAYYITEDGSSIFYVTYEDVDGMTTEEVMETLQESGATEVERAMLNGLDAVSYKYEEGDMVAVAITTERGYLLTFVFTPASDEDYMAVASLMTLSIQPTEEAE